MIQESCHGVGSSSPLLMTLPWRLPAPFTILIEVGASHLDGFGHVNNAVYIQWLEQCSWAHSAAVGLPLERCVALKRGMAIRRTEVDYLLAAQSGDRVVVGNWVTSASRLRAERQFEIYRLGDGAKLLQARIDYVCINLQTGQPTRFPQEFVEGYRAEPSVCDVFADQEVAKAAPRDAPDCSD